ncbi:hypothetical protein [Pseudomonas fluorescens]|uniref:Uncharacterized protein n=1 Tax=Pseudomonas fluorescens R124 TaxID=743713 RepID=A0A7U9CMB9_PSEFL|nr:hypothetical protein [Pseudomonas fluorescens]EJZ57956.1 hypothetical protein I1A_002281 [Pseudomonas fluorescens R124]
MKPLDLTRFDLNLLVVLEALWAERHVGRAAQVPTLILKPEEDKLIGKEAAGILLKGIKGSAGSRHAENRAYVQVFASGGVFAGGQEVSAAGRALSVFGAVRCCGPYRSELPFIVAATSLTKPKAQIRDQHDRTPRHG